MRPQTPPAGDVRLVARLAKGIDIVLGAREQLSQRAQVVLEVLDRRPDAVELTEGGAGVVGGVGGVGGEGAALVRGLRDDREATLDLGDLRVHPCERVSG